MFGRRAKRSIDSGERSELPVHNSRENSNGAEANTSHVATMTLELAPPEIQPGDNTGADTSAPIRAAGSGSDSGLADIEAEFTISDADMALLDLSSLAFEQQASQLSGSDAVLAKHQAELVGFITQLNATWTDRTGTPVDLQPYYMIPERCWEGEHQQVLIEVLGLAPAQAWNTLPLAADAATATAVGVVDHPGARALDNRNIATTLITDAVEKMHKTFERATFGTDTVDTAALDAARAQAASEIMAIARRMAGTIIGPDAVDHARATFFGD